MSNRIKELREKQAKIVAEARERNDLIQANTDEARTKELETQHDAAMAEFDRLEKIIEREEKLEALEKRAEEQRAKNRPTPRDGSAACVDEGEKPSYRAAFYRMIAAGGDLSELTAEERSVLRGGVPKDAELRVQTIGTTTAGGFTVPVELANQIVKTMALWGPMYDDNICTVIRTSAGNQINIPTVNDTGVAVVQHAEGTALTDDNSADATFGQRRLDAWVYDTKFIKFSMELAQDSIFNMEQLLGELLGERLGRRANTELTTGDGTGDPNGIVTASTLGVTAAAVAAITSDELINLVHSVNPAYRMSPKVRFMFNDTTLSAIRRLKDGQGQYLWQIGDFSNGIAPTLLGYAFSINQAMANPATGVRSVVFGDFGKYWVRKVGDPIIGVMRERFWPDLGIAGVIRLDGELADTAAVRHLIQA
jgi:HK97 family phage major capsid protein